VGVSCTEYFFFFFLFLFSFFLFNVYADLGIGFLQFGLNKVIYKVKDKANNKSGRS